MWNPSTFGGFTLAQSLRYLFGMGFKSLDEIVTFDFALNFRDGVYAHLRNCPQAMRDLRFRSDLEDAASSVTRNLAEGFARNNPAEFANFIRYALASLREAETGVNDGIARGYFKLAECRPTLRWAHRCRAAGIGLHRSQVALAAKNRENKAKRRRGRRGT